MSRNSMMLMVWSLVSKTKKKHAVMREMQISFAMRQYSGDATIDSGKKHTSTKAREFSFAASVPPRRRTHTRRPAHGSRATSATSRPALPGPADRSQGRLIEQMPHKIRIAKGKQRVHAIALHPVCVADALAQLPPESVDSDLPAREVLQQAVDAVDERHDRRVPGHVDAVAGIVEGRRDEIAGHFHEIEVRLQVRLEVDEHVTVEITIGRHPAAGGIDEAPCDVQVELLRAVAPPAVAHS